MGKIKYSPMALEDLQSLGDYIAENWGEELAKKKLGKIISDIKDLETYPLLGTNLAKNIDTPTDYRYLFTEKNYVFYHVEFDKVRIVRILNERQDYMKQLFSISKDKED